MSPRRTLNVTASFAMGAIAVFALDRALRRWRAARAARAAGNELGRRAEVQSRIEELVSHPDAIRFRFEGKMLRVSGHVLAAEMDRLLSELTRVPGVHWVHNALSPVQDARRFEELTRGVTPEPQAA